ncbi:MULTISPECIES: hypothetical protein [unclassified Microbacterium]|uniref:hypothetical protein n=1 Tax=unclassified Microbacterium TaxID=2609290 RepID=UPI00214BC14B|nr:MULTISPECIES: hypothetical protein [unclassified Microbacterium]MCR2809021.1 hypothetical protein [Microbacterium sp. zg.B185]WIM18569.1 hypothetical protein QNO12_13345 [Microbacterium sp. zg-B185]
MARSSAKVVTSATMSLDGFVANEDNDPGALFDWYAAGEVEMINAGALPPFHLTGESAGYWSDRAGVRRSPVKTRGDIAATGQVGPGLPQFCPAV